MCGLRCRLFYGSQRIHSCLDKYRGYKLKEKCAEFNIQAPSEEGTEAYSVDYNAKYECFSSGGFLEEEGFLVGNTTVNCITTWVMSWFPHANMTPIFVTTPRWLENPEKLNQECDSITMTVPTMLFFGDQSYPVAHSYWMCGGDQLSNSLPPRFVGLCALVRLRTPVTVVCEGVNEVIKAPCSHTNVRRKRHYEINTQVYINAVGQPKGIPYEFKARDEALAGPESILPWIPINKNVEWINYMYYNHQRILNYTIDGLEAHGEQLHATRGRIDRL